MSSWVVVAPSGTWISMRSSISNPFERKQPDHLAGGQAELDAVDDTVLVVPLGPVHPEEVTGEREPRRRYVVVLRVAEQQQRMPSEEDQPPARPEQPSRLGDPAVRVAPDRRAVLREGEVEALVAERRPFGVGMHEREPQVELLLEHPSRRELPARVVEPDRPSPAPGEPRRPVGGAAPELDHVEPVDVGEHAEVGFGHAPGAPGDLVARPGLVAGLDPVVRVGVPAFAVHEHVVLGHARTILVGATRKEADRDRTRVDRTDEGRGLRLVPRVPRGERGRGAQSHCRATAG